MFLFSGQGLGGHVSHVREIEGERDGDINRSTERQRHQGRDRHRETQRNPKRKRERGSQKQKL